MLILHVPCPLPPHERLWLKSTWQLLCSPPPFGSLSSALPCYATAPCSMPFYSAFLLLEEGEGEKVRLPHGVSSPSPCPWPEPLQITRIPSHIPSCAPMAHWTVLHAEPPQTTGLVAGEPAVGRRAPGKSPLLGTKHGCSPTWLFAGCGAGAGVLPSLAPSSSPACLRVSAKPLHLMGGWETRQLRHQPTPRHGAQLSPSALGCAASWHQAPLLCYKENIQIKQLTGFCSFPLFPIQN